MNPWWYIGTWFCFTGITICETFLNHQGAIRACLIYDAFTSLLFAIALYIVAVY